MAEFTKDEWKKIMTKLIENPQKYGLPERRLGSLLLGSFNIRKLGSVRKRSKETWEFLSYVCSHFDLISIQEIMEDLRGFQKLREYLGGDYGIAISDTTGVFPGEKGMGERLGFLYRRSLVTRTEVISDISLDRTKIIKSIQENLETLIHEIKDIEFKKIKLTTFIDFIRSPYLVSFQIYGHPEAKPYEFLAVNAHLYYGKTLKERQLEFENLMKWIMERVKKQDRTYYPNFILLGDLNLNIDSEKDIKRAIKFVKKFDDEAGEAIHINFPFIDVHQGKNKIFKTNVREDETFDHIAFIFTDERFPTFEINEQMGTLPLGPDYGVFRFVELFSDVIKGKPFKDLTKQESRSFIKRFEHEVSDHMPIWVRLPSPRDS